MFKCLRALLIQKSIKLCRKLQSQDSWFESFVNSEEYQTRPHTIVCTTTFESFVNSEEYQTEDRAHRIGTQFESFVNSEEYQTVQKATISGQLV